MVKYILIILMPLLLSVFIYAGCAYHKKSSKITSPSEAMQKVGWWSRPDFKDDLDKESLIEVIKKNDEYLARMDPDKMISYGNEKYSIEMVRESFNHLISIIKESKDNNELNRRIVSDFEIFQSVGRDKNNNVLFTGYYEPIMKGSLKNTEIYNYPIYALPDDLLEIKLEKFGNSFKGKRIMARIDGSNVVPYYNREKIDRDGILRDKDLEIVWLMDPVDAFFLHIQGSGIVQVDSGAININLNYTASNGRPYRSIGRLLINEEKVPKEKMSMKAIRDYLSSHPEDMERVLFYNESYVFFRTVEKGPVGSTAVTLTAGRSIASDTRLFPKGGLAYIESEIPVTDEKGEVTGWKKISRFVIDQDTGGAIKGPGRIDIFFGTGNEAGSYAGAMNRNGKLYYLIKKN